VRRRMFEGKVIRGFKNRDYMAMLWGGENKRLVGPCQGDGEKGYESDKATNSSYFEAFEGGSERGAKRKPGNGKNFFDDMSVPSIAGVRSLLTVAGIGERETLRTCNVGILARRKDREGGIRGVRGREMRGRGTTQLSVWSGARKNCGGMGKGKVKKGIYSPKGGTGWGSR